MSEKLSRPQPYVGVSGIVQVSQQRGLESVAQDCGLANQRLLLLGVKAVHKTQYLGVGNKYGPEWYPVGARGFHNALALAQEGSGTLGVAQVYFSAQRVDDREYRERFTQRIFRRGGAWMGGIQLDMLPWHTDSQMLDYLKWVKDTYDTKLLLQCHGPAMEALGPEGVVRRLGGIPLDYLLFDASHGQGEQLDTEHLASFLDAAHSATALDNVGLAIAGGLNSRVVQDKLPDLLSRFPDTSWDAEGQLHPKRADGTRPIDMDLASAYLLASNEVITAASQL